MRRFTQLHCLIWLCAAWRLDAQAPHQDTPANRFDVGVGLTLNQPKDVNQRPQCTELGLPCTSPKTFPDFGLALQVGANVATHVDVVAEASFYANQWVAARADSVAVARENHVRSLFAGVRVATGLLHLTKSDERGFHAFGQLLAGPEACNVLPTRFALQPGAGADFKLPSPGLSFRATADYRWTRGDGRNLTAYRMMGALIVGF